jgi:hypothetical protein
MRHYDYTKRGRFPCGALAGVPCKYTSNPEMITCPGCKEWYKTHLNFDDTQAKYAGTKKEFLMAVYGKKSLDMIFCTPEVWDKALRRAIEKIEALENFNTKFS